MYFILVCAYWDFCPQLFAEMPPKKKGSEARGEEHIEGVDSDYAVSSPMSAASTVTAVPSVLMTTEQLHLVLESVLGRLAPAVSSDPSAVALAPAVPRLNQIPVPKWTGEESPWEYFSKYEQAQKHNHVVKADWGPLLQVYLTGKAQQAYAQVDPDKLDDFDLVKETMLRSLGDTPEEADRRWWTLRRKKDETSGAFYLRMRATANRRFYGVKTRDEMFNKVLLSRFMALLPTECYNCISAKTPKTAEEAAEMVADYESRETFSKTYLAGESSTSHRYKREQGSYSNRVQGDNSSSRSWSNSQVSSNVNSSSPASSGSSNSVQNVQIEKGEMKERKPIICHGCKEPGHIRPNCPHRIRRVRSPECSAKMSVDGKIDGVNVIGMRVDTGADRTLVRKEFIPDSAYTGQSVLLDTWHGSQLSEHKLARISIQVGAVTVVKEVAVAEELEYPALLGLDLGKPLCVESMAKAFEQWKNDGNGDPIEAVTVCEKDEVVQAVRVTRAQAKRKEEDEQADDLASAQSECVPTSLGEIFDLSDDFYDESCVATPVGESVTLPGADVIDIPLPDLKEGSSRALLISEQQSDPSLKKILGLAQKRERGFAFDQGVLVHYARDELDDAAQRLVVPVGRRQQVLEQGHSSLLAGHFGTKKTYAKIARMFLWPRMWVEVRAFVRSCAGCQRAARNAGARAPLQPLPVVVEPFSKVAFDLVGPLPRSSSGYKYILTAMCLYTKYPEAIPLKRVDNVSVLEGLMEIFSRHGFPREILTDQGSVFMSKLTAECCKTFGISKVRTSPYHPQSDGALERWHACLKSMFKKSEEDLRHWDKLLKFVLFAYRETPHCVTGYPPFTLLFGREVRGPLALLRCSWAEDSGEECKLDEWLVSVKARIFEMSELVSERELKAKVEMKRHYDRTARAKLFNEGDMVIIRKPMRRGKLESSWEGPYEIDGQRSPVTYSVRIPGRPNKSKVIHCNLLKKWCTPTEKIHRVVVLKEDEEAEVFPTGLRLCREDFVPSVDEQKQLDEVLSEFEDVLCPKPGLTDKLGLSIRTGASEPVRCHPYRIAPRWKEAVKDQIDLLLGLGLIRPSESPWSSSVVTVQKKDGGIRICIDYRAVNSVTQPDPYLMPLIDEILESLATATYISKIDLNKGFHQIPIDERDIPKTAFCTPWGKFEFVVMPFGLRNGPAIFQRLMDTILHQDKDCCQVYIDDIAIFSQTWQQHCSHLSRVLGRLRGAGLTANVGKCQWGHTSCEFLGHVIGSGLVSPANLKVCAVSEFPTPRTKKQVRQFLGLTGYYRRFIEKYAEHTFALTEATKKSAPERVVQSELLLKECDHLKHVLCSLPSLTLAVPDDHFLLQTDASGVGIGAVLSVVREGVELPVAFFSRKLQLRERKYGATELEGLAVVAAVSHFDAYLVTHPFVVETDHRALTFLNSADHKNGRLARWAIRLQPYSFEVRYRAGPLNVNADVLSRGFEEEDSSALCPIGPPEEGGGGGGGGGVML